MTLGGCKSLSTQDLLKTLGIDTNEMQDPHEFERLLFDLIQRSLQATIIESVDPLKNLQDLLPTTFGGDFVFKTTCQKCFNSTLSTQHFLDVSLPIVSQDKGETLSKKIGSAHV